MSHGLKKCLMNIWAKFQFDLISLTQVFNQKVQETQNFDASIFYYLILHLG